MTLHSLVPLLFVAPLFAQSYSASTIAGTTVIRDGIPAAQAFLRNPTGVAVDSQGNIYVSDADDNRIRKIGRDGLIVTIAGSSAAGFSGDGKPAVQSRLRNPRSLVVDRTNTYLYFVDAGNLRVRRIGLATGEILTIAGNGTSKSTGDGDQATRAGMSPYAIALDTTGASLFIVEYVNNRVRKLDLASGVISAFAGSGTFGDSGDNGPGPNALLALPKAIAVDANSAYIADWGNSLIRKVDLKTNILTTFGGLGFPVDYGDNGPVDRAAFYGPDGIHADAEGNLLILDGSKLRFIATGSNLITAVAGVADSIGFAGDGGALSAARFANPSTAIIVRKGEYLIADSGNYRVRRIQGSDLSTVIGSGAVDGKAATETLFNLPTAISRDSAGNIFIADTANNRIRKITAGTNIVSTVAGTGVYGSLNGRIAAPGGVLAASDGVYFSDSGNNRVYRIAADGIKLVTGAANGAPGFTGDGQLATSARLRTPRGLTRDANGNLYIADWDNGRVRRISPEGVIATVAGNGQLTASGDGGPAIAAGLSRAAVVVDSAGNLYIADDINNRIRKVTSGSGVITTVAGTGQFGNTGDGGPATQAQLILPFGIAVDAQNNLFISDTGNAIVRRVDGRTGVITSAAGNGSSAFNGESGPALGLGMLPTDIIVEPVGGTLLIADSTK